MSRPPRDSASSRNSYVLSDGHVFSMTLEDFTIYTFSEETLHAFPSSPRKQETLQEQHDAVLSFLHDLQTKHTKTVSLGGVIPSFTQKVKPALQDKQSFTFSKPGDDDYSFAEMSAQQSIAEQLLQTMQDLPTHRLEQYVTAYREAAQPVEHAYLQQFDEKLSSLEERRKSLQKSLKQARQQIKSQERTIDKQNKAIEDTENRLTETEARLTHPLSSSAKQEQRRRKVKRAITKATFAIEDLQLTIDVHEARLQTLNEWWKLGKRKYLPWQWALGSLGLLYMTRLADLRYQARKEKSRIATSHEQIATKQREKKRYEHELQLLDADVEEELSETRKQELETQKHQLKRELENKQEKLQTLRNTYQERVDEKDRLQHELDEVKEEIHTKKENRSAFQQHHSLSVIEERLDALQNHISQEYARLQELIGQLEEQQVNIKGNWIATPKKSLSKNNY